MQLKREVMIGGLATCVVFHGDTLANAGNTISFSLSLEKELSLSPLSVKFFGVCGYVSLNGFCLAFSYNGTLDNTFSLPPFISLSLSFSQFSFPHFVGSSGLNKQFQISTFNFQDFFDDFKGGGECKPKQAQEKRS